MSLFFFFLPKILSVSSPFNCLVFEPFFCETEHVNNIFMNITISPRSIE